MCGSRPLGGTQTERRFIYLCVLLHSSSLAGRHDKINTGFLEITLPACIIYKTRPVPPPPRIPLSTRARCVWAWLVARRYYSSLPRSISSSSPLYVWRVGREVGELWRRRFWGGRPGGGEGGRVVTHAIEDFYERRTICRSSNLY